MASEMERIIFSFPPLKRIFKEKRNIIESLIQNFQVQKLCQQSLIANMKILFFETGAKTFYDF